MDSRAMASVSRVGYVTQGLWATAEGEEMTTYIAIEELVIESRTIEQIVESETIVPRRIGFCSNPTSMFEICGASIDDQDVLAVELEPKNGRRTFCCGRCVESILTRRSGTMQEDSDKSAKATKIRWEKGLNVGRKSSPRVHKGEDLLK